MYKMTKTNCIKSKIHLVLIFEKGLRSVSRLTVVACGYPVVPVSSVPKLIFLHHMASVPLTKIS